MKKSITITDIAKEAGVSISTVSRVLTGNAKVASEKREKVESLIKKYDFRPNMFARGLLSTQTGLVGVLVADIRNPFYSTMFVSLEQAASLLGYNLLLCNSFGDRVKEFELLDNLARQQVDAIIMIGGAVDELVTDMEYAEKVNLISERIPFVITGRLDGTTCVRVNIDEIKAMTIVMEHLASISSFRQLALIGGSTKVKSSVDLRACFRRQLKRFGLAYNAAFDVANMRYDEEGGYAAMNGLFEAGTVPDALIAVNDFTAVGAIRSIQEHSLRIPDDISIVAFDDTYLASIMEPKLTSVSYNYRLFGETLMKNAVALIQGRDVPQESFIEPKLVIRGSCRMG